MTHWSVSDTAAKLHADALVWDNHVCLPHVVDDGKWMHELRRHKANGANVIMLNIGDSDVDLSTQIHMLAHFRRWVSLHPEEFMLIHSVADIAEARRTGRLGIGFDIEGAHAIDDLSLVSLFYELGVRWMLFAYNRNNQVAGGCHDDDPGLSAFGLQLVEEMDRVGMIKCCSHTGYRSALDVMNHTELPVIFSHSNPRALKDHPRNIPDELIVACAKTGGVVCLNGVGIFLGDNDNSPDLIARHIDYVVQLVGVEHAGIGLDIVYDLEGLGALLASGSAGLWPAGFGYDGSVKLAQPEILPQITEALLRLNYSEGDIRKILGENLLRIAARVWR